MGRHDFWRPAARRPQKEKLTKSGIEVEQVLDEIGCVIGTASDDVVKQLRITPGVVDISQEPSVDIGPPDAPVTW